MKEVSTNNFSDADDADYTNRKQKESASSASEKYQELFLIEQRITERLQCCLLVALADKERDVVVAAAE